MVTGHFVVANVAGTTAHARDVHQCPHWAWLTEVATTFNVSCDFACGWGRDDGTVTFCSALLSNLNARRANRTVIPPFNTGVSVTETISQLERVTGNCPFAPTSGQA